MSLRPYVKNMWGRSIGTLKLRFRSETVQKHSQSGVWNLVDFAESFKYKGFGLKGPTHVSRVTSTTDSGPSGWGTLSLPFDPLPSL